MIELFFNGAPVQVETGSTVASLLQTQGLGERRVAVEANGEIVPRSLHASTLLQAGDRIEVVHAIGGG